MNGSPKPPPNGKGTVTPYIAVKGAAGFLDFLKQAFAAEELGRAPNPDGTIGHAEVRIGNSVLMVFDAKADWTFTPAFLCIYVDDADATYANARAAGASPVTELATFSIIGDRVGRVRDPFGNIWWIQTHLEDVSPEETMIRLQDPEQLATMEKMQSSFTAEMDRLLQAK